MTEPREVRLKRLKIRSWRRGTKEMDLILGGWSDAHLPRLDAEELDIYEAILDENDHDLYHWITGRGRAPEPIAPLIGRIARDISNG